METISSSYKLIKRVRDTRFNEEELHQYELIIQIGPKDFQIAVIDTSESRLMLLEDYATANVQSHDELLIVLKDLFDNHALLNAGFWRNVKIGIKHNKFCQIPAALFDETRASDYLKLNATIDESKEIVLHCSNTGFDAVTIFAVQTDLYNWLTGIYQRTTHRFYHQSTALIEGVLHDSKDTPNVLYIYIDRFKLHILSAQFNKLIYYNQFAIKQFSDYVKYIMLVQKGLGMDQQTSEIVMWGFIGQNSPHYIEFVKYIRNVVFGSRADYLKFSYLFDEIQEHHFFDLYALSLLKN